MAPVGGTNLTPLPRLIGLAAAPQPTGHNGNILDLERHL
jgi:hypothetical protein